MSARAAAEALLRYDADLAEFARGMQTPTFGKADLVRSFVERHVVGTWTLSLAADAARCSEEQVVAALLQIEPLRYGSTAICRLDAAEMFGSHSSPLAQWRRKER